MLIIVAVICIALIAGMYFVYMQPNDQAMSFLKRHNVPVSFIINVDRTWSQSFGIGSSDWWEVSCGYIYVDEPWNSTIMDVWINLKTDQYHIVSVVIP